MADARLLRLDDRSDFDVPVDQRETSTDRNLSEHPVGQDLRTARLRKGITPEAIWRDLKIAPHHLIALEDGCFDTLPGRVYVVGFVRSYARYLGLDVEKCLARLKAELPAPEIQPPPVAGPLSPSEADPRFRAAPVETVTSGSPDTGLFVPRERAEISPERGIQQYVVIGLIIIVLGYGGYNVFSSARLTAPSSVVPVPARLVTEAGISPTKAKAQAVVADRQTVRVPPAAAPIASSLIGPSDPVSVRPLASIEPTLALPAEPNHASSTEYVTNSVPLGSRSGLNAVPMRPKTTIQRLTDLTPKPNRTEPTEAARTSAIPMRPESNSEPAPALPAESVGVASIEAASAKELAPTASEQGPRFRPPLPLGTRYGLENGNSRVVLRLHRSIRVAVKGSRNHVFIDRILGAGATYRVPNTPGVKLSVPDAGAVEVILDGNTVGFAGKDGRAARELGLDPPSIIRRYHWQ